MFCTISRKIYQPAEEEEEIADAEEVDMAARTE